MTRNQYRTKLFTLLAVLAMTACGPATSHAVSPAAAQVPTPAHRLLLRVVDAFSAGNNELALTLSDSLLMVAPPAQSQLQFLGAYYTIKSRQVLGSPAESLEEVLGRVGMTVSDRQRAELAYLVHGPAEVVPQAGAGGPRVAYKLGVVLPLSGQHYQFGEAVLEGVKLAVDEYNRNSQGMKVELDVRDDAGEPVRAGSLGRTLAADSSIAALIGSHGNESSLSLALVSSSQAIPLVCPTADAPGLDAIGATVHVLNRTDRRLSSTVGEAAVKMMGLHTFAVMAEQDERGDLLARGFIEQVRSSGGTVVADLRYSPDASNFEDQMAFIQRYLPDGIFMTAKSDMITQLASQVHYYGMGKVQLIGGEYWDSERVIRMGGDYVDGGLFSSPFYAESDRLRWRQFKTLYESARRKPVNRFSAYGYDAAGIILSSMGELPVSRIELSRKMCSGREYDGATGIYTIDRDGRVEREYFILRLVSGKIVPAEPAPLPVDTLEVVPDSTVEQQPPAESQN